jgi:hypothetical protein
MTQEENQALTWLYRKDGDGVELWEFPAQEELPTLLSRGLVSVGPSSRDERMRVRLTEKGEQAATKTRR